MPATASNRLEPAQRPSPPPSGQAGHTPQSAAAPPKPVAVALAPAKPAPPPAPQPAASHGDEPYEVVAAIIVYHNRALQIMGGVPSMTTQVVQAVNRYQQEFGPDVMIYFMAMPIGSDFYLPRKVNQGVMREKIMIDHIHASLDPSVRPVRAYDRLAEHTSDYIYFNTDHHWTGLGAYYAYRAFAQAARFDPLPLSALTKGEIPNFLGTLYHRTLSPTLKAKGDSVEYYKIPNRTEARVYMGSSTAAAGSPGHLYAEYARGGNAYGVFLGGDFPLMRITSDVKNGRRIAVIKDSYGNAFVPYLAAHYEDVFVIDYRYYRGNIKTLIGEHGIQNVLFAHNTFVVASGYTAQRALSFLNAAAQ